MYRLPAKADVKVAQEWTGEVMLRALHTSGKQLALWQGREKMTWRELPTEVILCFTSVLAGQLVWEAAGKDCSQKSLHIAKLCSVSHVKPRELGVAVVQFVFRIKARCFCTFLDPVSFGESKCLTLYLPGQLGWPRRSLPSSTLQVWFHNTDCPTAMPSPASLSCLWFSSCCAVLHPANSLH